jgi:uncharacterized protein
MSRPLILWSTPDVGIETDCACPPSSVEQASCTPFDPTRRWQRGNLAHFVLDAEHRAVINAQGPASVVVLNKAAAHLLDSYCDAHAPVQVAASRRDMSVQETISASARLAVAGLLRPCESASAPGAIIHTLTAWLHMTSDCMLRCSYCYVPKSKRAMSEDVARAAVDAVFRSAVGHGFRSVKIKYAGGEPTLNMSALQAAHQRAEQQAEVCGLPLTEILLSNGVALTQPILAYLHAAGIKLMISLDGVGAAHDRQRPTANGRGSFALVASAIDRACAAGLQPDLSVTVTAENASALAQTALFALQKGLRFNFNLCRQDSDGLGQDERIIPELRAALAAIAERLPSYRIIDGLIDRSTFAYPHDRACGAGISYLVVDEYGGVHQCHMDMTHAVATVAAHDALAAVKTATSAESRATENCGSCIWRRWCGGGCPRLRDNRGYATPSSRYCTVYKAVFPDLVRLEGLRLLAESRPIH